MSEIIVTDPERQSAALQFISHFIVDSGYSPSMREIAAGLGIGSTDTVRRMLQSMRSSGEIEYEDNVARSIRLPWG